MLIALSALSFLGGLVTAAQAGPVHTATAPDHLVSLGRNTAPALQQALDALVTGSSATETTAAGYGPNAEAKPTLLLFLFKRPAGEPPKARLEEVGTEITAGTKKMAGTTVSDPTPVDPGPLGGSAECWTVHSQTNIVVFCVWASNGLVGAVEEPSTDAEKTGGVMRAVRSEIEKVG